jgi:dolichyl-diphosphooligosaccharide---protein glycosyltransferase
LNSQTSLFQINSFNLKINHLFIIGILVLAFSISFLIRSQPAEYGFELNEFDPFFNFRATEYIVENGFSEYFQWHDTKSWHLSEEFSGISGRNVSATSQIMLHSTAAISYQIFAGNSSLYDFTILFPVIIGSLTVVVIFALVRLFAGTTAGLFASLLFAVSLPILMRGSIGWFKSEPLGIFYGLMGLYLFLSAIKSENKKIASLKIIFGGIVMAFGMASWGGNQFFVIPIGLFILALPFLRKDHKFLLWSIPLFVGIFLLISGSFERPGPNFVFGLGGLSLIIPTMFLISSIFIQKISKDENKIRNSLFLLISIIVIGSFLVIINDESNILPLPSFRYLNAINPFLTTTDPLVDSVAEHASTSIKFSYLFHSVWMIFAGIGIWLILSRKIPQNFVKNDMKAFVLIFAITGVFISSSFIRLEIFASISLIILSSVSLSILTKNIFKITFSGKKNNLLKISYVIIIIFLFILPLVFPENNNWISHMDTPPIIFTGATSNPPTNDWLETLEWIKLNTPENAVIASWWDYGYWIQTMAERTTLIDNATLSTWQIAKMAKMFLSTPVDSWNMLKEMDADYVLVFLSAQKVNDNLEDKLYVLGGGGDESKVGWFARIAELPIAKYLKSDGLTGTNYFNEQTMLGKMIPFSTAVYYDPTTQENSAIYKPGFIEIVIKNIEYDSDNDPLKLVYASPSFMNEKGGHMTIVLVYEINKNYVPIFIP